MATQISKYSFFNQSAQPPAVGPGSKLEHSAAGEQPETQPPVGGPVSSGATSPQAIGGRTPAPCPVVGKSGRCECAVFWLDPYGKLHCSVCRPPLNAAMVRRRYLVTGLPGNWEWADLDGEWELVSRKWADASRASPGGKPAVRSPPSGSSPSSSASARSGTASIWSPGQLAREAAQRERDEAGWGPLDRPWYETIESKLGRGLDLSRRNYSEHEPGTEAEHG